MSNVPRQLDKLRVIINNCEDAYQKALQAGKKFSDVKIFYLRTKKLKKIFKKRVREHAG